MIDVFPSRTVAVQLGGLAIHWYGILYVVAFGVGYLLVQRLQRYRAIDLSSEQWSSLLSWVVLGVILGGRLGYVFLYEPVYFVQHPLEIFAVWKGGMSSHGGFIGVMAALLWVSWRSSIPFLALMDTIAVPAALGLALGRVGNFINLELYGTATDVPWGMEFPGAQGVRHPTQLYALLKNLFIAAACMSALHWTKGERWNGIVIALFAVFYSVLRFALEYVRVPTHQGIAIAGIEFTRGQVFTMPLLAAGVVLLLWIVGRNAGAARRGRTG